MDGLGGELDWGFAEITKFSNFYGEREVLFNPINIFKVVDCQKDYLFDKKTKVEKFILLEFGGFEKLRQKVNRGEVVPEKDKKVITNYLHQQETIGGGF